MNPSTQSKSVRSMHDERAFHGFESLEGRLMMSTGPTIGSLTIAPTTVTRGTDAVITASNVTYTGGTVARVGFYYDKNKDGIINTGDIFLGLGTKQTDGTTYLLTHRTRFAPLGTDTILARGVGTDKTVGNTASTTITINDAPPTILSLTTSKSTIAPGARISLIAPARDLDGRVSKVEFYVDTNNDGIAQDSEKLGQSGPGGFLSSTVVPSSLMPTSGSTVTFLAKATDDSGSVSTLASKTISLEQAPTVTALTSSSATVTKPATFTLTATGVADADGTVKRVTFWLDRNNDGIISTGDIAVGIGSQSNSDPTSWSITLGSNRFSKGPHQFLVKAIDNNNNGNNESLHTTTVTIA